MLGKATLLATVVLSALALTASPAQAVVFTPGAPSIGDSYYPLVGNGGYDVGHYDLAIRYDPATDVLTGVDTITATATQNLSSFDLDLYGLTVRSVTVGGRPAAWDRRGGELVVTPARGLPTGRAFTTVVRYDGVPRTLGDSFAGVSGFIPTDDGAVIAGEPGVASTWFAVNDHPLDKASYSFRVTVPAGTEAVANGVPAGMSTAAGWSTWSWVQDEPMASYLATATMGQFDLTSYTAGSVRFVDAIDPDVADTSQGAVARASMAREPEILRFLASNFGPYPFVAAGGIVDDNLRLAFALENQTRPIYPKINFTSPESGDSVIVHELAHQWYGDSLALADWRYMWLNEGFATYAEWLWSEHEGLGTAQQIFDTYYAEPAASAFWDLPIGDPGPDDLFASEVYIRGAMTLQALRLTIGDGDFFALLPAWSAAKEGGNVTTAEFQALAEQISGLNLDALFTQWLSAGKPPPPPGTAAPGGVPVTVQVLADRLAGR